MFKRNSKCDEIHTSGFEEGRGATEISSAMGLLAAAVIEYETGVW